jgi:murein DD-endopeptidase MepM/ murein hydrolase activator NlpD
MWFCSSCGHLSRPQFSPGEDSSQGTFVPQGENTDDDEDESPKDLSNSKEMLSSPEVRENSRSIERGVFRVQWPVARMKVNRGFSEGVGHDHLGMDIGGKKGDKIFAAHDGVVVYAGHGFRGYGNMILLEFDKTWATLYGHLSRIRVKTGQPVHAGAIIGEMGRTGHATGVHLHFEVIKNKNPVDPAPLLRGDSVAKK